MANDRAAPGSGESAASATIVRAADALAGARSVAVITGAGMSAESGVPTFRGAGGLWRRFRPEDLATPEAFARNPTLVWEWYWWRRRKIGDARPNAGHLALARLEPRFPELVVLTQNVDGLHQDAGSRRVLELHGSIWRARCSREPGRVVDERRHPVPEVDVDEPVADRPLPTCEACGALLRPDVVWFGEPLDEATLERAAATVRACDVLLVVGTSAVVYPVAGLPALARRGRAVVIEVNVEDTPFTSQADIVLRGPSGVLLKEVEARL